MQFAPGLKILDRKIAAQSLKWYMRHGIDSIMQSLRYTHISHLISSGKTALTKNKIARRFYFSMPFSFQNFSAPG
jgi:hypothetical protein